MTLRRTDVIDISLDQEDAFAAASVELSQLAERDYRIHFRVYPLMDVPGRYLGESTCPDATSMSLWRDSQPYRDWLLFHNAQIKVQPGVHHQRSWQGGWAPV
jgi:hypothetical protein